MSSPETSDSPDLFQLVERLVAEAGLLLVDMTMKNTGRKYMIRILVDRPGRIGVNECARLSRTIQDAMDEDMLLSEMNYRLEVGSPGIGRPLSTEVDWIRCVGRLLSISLEDDENFTDELSDYSSGMLTFSGGREVPAEAIVSAVEVLE
jgi:ribosome maturation factor RimP